MYQYCKKSKEDKTKLIEMMKEHERNGIEVPMDLKIDYLVNHHLCKEQLPGMNSEDWKNYNREVEGAVYPQDGHHRWEKAINEKNWKCILLMRLEDEVNDACMDIEVFKLAKLYNETEIYTVMHNMVEQRINNAEKLNDLYVSIADIDLEKNGIDKYSEKYADIIEKHKSNISKL